MFSSTTIAWAHHKQGYMITSTIVAKLIESIESLALIESIKEIIWLYQFLHSLDATQELTTIIYNDNQVTIAFVKNLEYLCQIKYIDIKYFIIQKYYKNNSIDF